MNRLLATAVTVTLLIAPGCSTYALQGKVVLGPKSTVTVVDADDPRLAGIGIEGATLEFVLDPESGNRQLLGSTHADYEGAFSFPVNVTGAGFLEYEIMVIARAPERSPAVATFALPPKGKQLLVTMVRGRDHAPVNTDPLGESMNEVDRWMK